MQANVGSMDRIVRILVGAALIALPYVTALEMWANPMIKYGANAVGAILILTALVRFCPLFKLLGISSVRS
jgi:DUF2892 family protein